MCERERERDIEGVKEREGGGGEREGWREGGVGAERQRQRGRERERERERERKTLVKPKTAATAQRAGYAGTYGCMSPNNAVTISGKHNFGDLRFDLQRKLLHNCSGTWSEVTHV